LRDFEADIENHLPKNRKKLDDFRNLAKKVIEGRTVSDRKAASDVRT